MYLNSLYIYKCSIHVYEHICTHKVAKFIVPDWGDKVDSGIGLSFRPATARLHWLAGRYDNPFP